MLKVKNISKSINNKKIINDISFSISAGNIYGLLGPNGAGKTTTFYTIAGLIKSDKGKIFLGNEDLTKLPMHERSRLGIKYLPQEPSIFLDLTVPSAETVYCPRGRSFSTIPSTSVVATPPPFEKLTMTPSTGTPSR